MKINSVVFPRRSCRSALEPARGVTLVELLVVVAIIGIFLAVAGRIVVDLLRFTRDMELAQRQRDNASRMSTLVQIEAGEASSVSVGSSGELSAQCTNPPAGDIKACLVIPKTTGSYQDPANVSNVYYYTQGDDVRRRGPRTLQNGSLDHDSLTDGVLVRGGTMNTGITCDGESSNEGQLVYRLEYSQSAYQPLCSIAYAKTVYIR